LSTQSLRNYCGINCFGPANNLLSRLELKMPSQEPHWNTETVQERKILDKDMSKQQFDALFIFLFAFKLQNARDDERIEIFYLVKTPD
jgi:hypothetical protein